MVQYHFTWGFDCIYIIGETTRVQIAMIALFHCAIVCLQILTETQRIRKVGYLPTKHCLPSLAASQNITRDALSV